MATNDIKIYGVITQGNASNGGVVRGNEVIGAFISVDDLSTRNNINESTLKKGMIVYVVDQKQYYQYTGDTQNPWVIFNFSDYIYLQHTWGSQSITEIGTSKKIISGTLSTTDFQKIIDNKSVRIVLDVMAANALLFTVILEYSTETSTNFGFGGVTNMYGSEWLGIMSVDRATREYEIVLTDMLQEYGFKTIHETYNIPARGWTATAAGSSYAFQHTITLSANTGWSITNTKTVMPIVIFPQNIADGGLVAPYADNLDNSASCVVYSNTNFEDQITVEVLLLCQRGN